MRAITITEYTDPACPWAYSAEPARLRIKWLYGEHIDWRLRMVGLSESVESYASIGFTPERQASAHADFAARYGMPFNRSVMSRMAATVPACQAVVAARLHAPEQEWLLLRALRVHNFAGELIDEPETIAAAARDAGLDPDELAAWAAAPDAVAALAEDMRAARDPSAAALALNHKLAGWPGGRRYTCPSWEIAGAGGLTLAAPGFQPAAVYETLIANVAPALARRAAPSDVEELLDWCDAPPSTAEVAEVLGISLEDAREALRAVADLDPLGEDGFWLAASLVATPAAANQ
jgi:predicted DsbA family dithiol-disulfide isomerase